MTKLIDDDECNNDDDDDEEEEQDVQQYSGIQAQIEQ